MRKKFLRWPVVGALAAALFAVALTGVAVAATTWPADTPDLTPGTRFPVLPEETEQELLRQDLEFVSGRTAGDTPIDVRQAGALRAHAVRDARKLDKTKPPTGPPTFAGPWTQIGPTPIGEI